MTKVIQYGGADLYPKQREAIFAPERISLVESSTKAGKTSGALAWIFEEALKNRKDTNVWWVAPVFRQAEIGFRRMCAKLPKGFYKANQSKLTITLVNGVRIWFQSAERPEDLYGEDVYAAVLDEASRMREAAWIAVRTTLTATRGPVRMIGNVRGRNNWFYRLCRLAEEGATDMAYHRITWEDAVEAGVLDQEEVLGARRDFERLGKLGIWRQLYDAVAIADDENPFGLAAIEACLIPGQVAKVRASGECVWVNPAELWPRAAGVDLAGRGAQNMNLLDADRERDYTALLMLDRDGITTRLERWRGAHQETQDRILTRIGSVMSLVDSTGAGDQQVEMMQRKLGPRVEGYVFSQRSRQDLLEGLALAIGDCRVHFPDGPLRDELDSFEYQYTGNGLRFAVPETQHDDLAIALALAVKRLPWRRSGISGPIGVPKPGGSLWTPEGATARAEPSILGDQPAPPPDTSAVPDGTPVPILVGGSGSGASRWNLQSR